MALPPIVLLNNISHKIYNNVLSFLIRADLQSMRALEKHVLLLLYLGAFCEVVKLEVFVAKRGFASVNHSQAASCTNMSA